MLVSIGMALTEEPADVRLGPGAARVSAHSSIVSVATESRNTGPELSPSTMLALLVQPIKCLVWSRDVSVVL